MYYEQRYIKEPKQSLKIQFFDDQSRKTLSDIVAENNRIVLLGNPGIGKSTELNILFDFLWEKRGEGLNFPFRIDLKNFRSVSKFEDLIPFAEWKELPNITFILDGLDEIAAIQDFISELESFLNKNNDKNINVVLSCRTNIYEKYLINVSGFKYFYLDGLSDRQINNILEKRISKQLNNTELNRFRVYLENPFNINLFCEYYDFKGTYPEKQSEVWDLFVENQLKKLSKEKLIKREDIDVPHIKKCLEKVAFTNELMQQNFIAENHLYELLGTKDKSIFEQIAFIERLPDSDNYTFSHKNYQEFFSAKLLAEFSATEIIQLIKITPKENKTKPSLFNTITFLLNIIEPEKLSEIEKWLLENEPEVLFLAEKGKLGTSTEHKIFKRYFHEISVEKTFWFGRDRRFSIDKIAEFADIDFLIETIKKDEHFRSVISALDVLSYTDASIKDKDVKAIFKDLIFEESRYKDEALRSFRIKRFHKTDPKLFTEIAEHFYNSFSPEINHQLIAMIADFQKVDHYFSIFINSLYKLYEINPERPKDNTMRGTLWLLEKIILKIENVENFLEVLNVIFNHKFELKLSDFYNKDFKNKLLTRILYFVDKDNNFLFRVIDAFLKPEHSFIYRKDEILVEIINRTSKDINAFRYIVNTYGLSDKNYLFLSLFDNKLCIDYLVKKYKSDELKIQTLTDINFLRNKYFNNSHELGYYFEEVFKNVGYEFSQELPSEEQIAEDNKNRKIFVQRNFEILFDRSALSLGVEKVFKEHNVEYMTWKMIHDIEWDWYIKKDIHGIQNSVFRVIAASVKNNDNKTKESVIKHINNDYFLLFQIKDKIKDRESEGFEVKEDHISFIVTKARKFSEEFMYDRVIKVKPDGNVIFYNYYSIMKLLYFFDKKYDIHYSQDFYLQTLKYCNVLGNVDGNIEFVKERVNDLKLFNQQIVENLNNEELESSSLKDHIEHAIENKLSGTYAAIEEYFLNDRFIYSQKNFLSRYTDLLTKAEQVIYLEKFCSDINSYQCWKAVEVMLEKQINNDLILDIAKRYLSAKNDNFVADALNVLFYCNAESTLLLYRDLLYNFSKTEQTDYRDDYNVKDISNYKRLDELDVLVEIFEIIYGDSFKETFDFYHSKNVIKALVSNLSGSEEGYLAVQKLLYGIKSKVTDKDDKFFYVNMLIEDSQLAYYASISKPCNFKEAKGYLEKVESSIDKKTLVMGDVINISGGSFNNSQIGGSNNNLYHYAGKDEFNEVKELLQEFEQLRIENKEWKNIIVEGLQDLAALSDAQTLPEQEISKSRLRKFHDFIYDIGKRTNDWKNLVFLPIEFHDKTPKLMQLGESLMKLLNLK